MSEPGVTMRRAKTNEGVSAALGKARRGLNVGAGLVNFGSAILRVIVTPGPHVL